MNTDTLSAKTLCTKWCRDTRAEVPLPEYPRPSLVREHWFCLNGSWDFTITGRDTGIPKDFPERIQVPYAVETSASGIGRSIGADQAMWYRKGFRVPQEWAGRQVILNFEAVDWACEVYVNGKLTGNHRGGYLPFSCNVTANLLELSAQQELMVRVLDPTDTDWQQCGLQRLHPERGFHTASSGIRQSVWLEPVNECYISDISIRTYPERGNAECSVMASGGTKLVYTISDHGKRLAVCEASPESPATLQIPYLINWNTEVPHMYDLRIVLYHGRKITDSVQSQVAVRSCSSGQDREGHHRFFLNNMPLMISGVLYQPLWPESGLTAPSDEALVHDLELVKELGFNTIRCYATVASRRFYYHCDRLGILVMQDMVPNAGFSRPRRKIRKQGLRSLQAVRRESELSRSDFRRELREMVVTLGNSPSIFMWAVFSEGWGQFNAAEISSWLELFDPSRLVDHAAGSHDMGAGHVASLTASGSRITVSRQTARISAVSRYRGLSVATADHLHPNALDDFLASLYAGKLKKYIGEGLGIFVYEGLTDTENLSCGLATFDRERIKVHCEGLRELNLVLQQEFQRVV